MGTIAEKLSYLADTKDLFKDRLNSLGAEITSSTTFRNYLNWLDTFYGEVSDKTDLSQNGVIGRTSQETTTGKNLFTNALRFNNETKNGLTLTNNNDGSFTVVGTANADGQFTATLTTEEMINDGTYLKAGTYYQQCATRLQLHDENGAWVSNTWRNFTTTSDLYVKGMFIEFTNGTTYNDTYYYQVEQGSTATSYEPYTNGASPNSDYPQPINNLSGDIPYKVSGKNLFNENYYSDKTKYEKYGNYYAFVELPDTFKTKFYANVFLKGISNNLTICFNDSKSIPSNDKKVLNAGVINSNVEFDFTNAEKIYIGIGNGLGVDVDTDINNIFNNYNIMVSTTSGEQYEPYIEPQTFNIPLKSKNLFDKNTTNKLNGYFERSGDTIHSSGVNRVFYLECKPNTTYAFTQGETNISNHVFQMASTIEKPDINVAVENFVDRSGYNPYKTFTYTTNANAKYLVIRLRSADTTNEFLNGVQIEENNEITAYEPYYDIELCKITTYEDKIYSSNGRFYLNKKTGKVVLNGSEVNWTYDGASTTPTPRTVMGNNLFEITNSNYYSNYFKQGSTTSYRLVLQPSNNNIYISLDNNLVGIVSEDTNSQKVTKMKNWLSTHNTIVYYPLATPTTTEITQENYPSLYNALKQIQDYLTAYKINKEFILGYSSPEIEY